MSADWAERARFAGWATWAGYGLLVGQQVADAMYYHMPLLLWVGKLLPLLLFLPFMLRGNLRSYLWLCFICLWYFIRLVERVFALPDSALAITGLAAVVVLFIAAMLYVRWESRARAESAGS
jgi:uncharacterized membrane protein